MSFDIKVSTLSPDFYMPMDDREERIPFEVIGGATVSSFGGRPLYSPPELFLGEFCRLEGDSHLEVDSNALSPYTDYSYGFWFKVGYGDADIFEIRTESSGTGLVARSGQLRFHFDGNLNKVIDDVDSEKVYFAFISFDGTNIKFYLDGTERSSDPHTPPVINTVSLGKRSSGPKVGECALAGVTGFKRSINSQTIEDLYNSGAHGFSKRVRDSGSSLRLLENKVDSYQTSWQAYGIVVVKD